MWSTDAMQIVGGYGWLRTINVWLREHTYVHHGAISMLSCLESWLWFSAPVAKEAVDRRVEILGQFAGPSLGLSTPNATWTPFVYVKKGKKKKRSLFVLKPKTSRKLKMLCN